VEFNNTGVEFPETLRFMYRLKDEWGLNLHVTKPERDKDFWWCLRENGYPLLGKFFVRRRTEWISEKQRKVMESGARLSPSCCWYCKEKPAKDLHKALGVDLIFLGIMAHESRRRKFNWCDYGDFHWNKKEKIWKVHPLSVWLEEDILEYHRRFNTPMCDLYAMGHRRNGCWPCGMDIAFKNNHLAALRLSHPKLWRFLMIDKGLGEELLKIKLALNDGQANLFSSTWSVEELLEQRPCFFDSL
jgi:3'-phosphoadenosine 5'-phosphosulfate sulfotransferase (PAPS reductase)/FAD synthetase